MKKQKLVLNNYLEDEDSKKKMDKLLPKLGMSKFIREQVKKGLVDLKK